MIAITLAVDMPGFSAHFDANLSPSGDSASCLGGIAEESVRAISVELSSSRDSWPPKLHWMIFQTSLNDLRRLVNDLQTATRGSPGDRQAVFKLQLDQLQNEIQASPEIIE